LRSNFVRVFFYDFNEARNHEAENYLQPKGQGAGTKTQSKKKRGKQVTQRAKSQFGRSQVTSRLREVAIPPKIYPLE